MVEENLSSEESLKEKYRGGQGSSRGCSAIGKNKMQIG
jgi:hypothetical protein